MGFCRVADQIAVLNKSIYSIIVIFQIVYVNKLSTKSRFSSFGLFLPTLLYEIFVVLRDKVLLGFELNLDVWGSD